MPAFGRDGMLKRPAILAVADYTRSLSGLPVPADANLALGKKVFAENCAACHGDNGKGNREIGAPNLTDQIWLYGSAREAIVEGLTNGRGGVMPAWAPRLDDTTIKALDGLRPHARRRSEIVAMDADLQERKVNRRRRPAKAPAPSLPDPEDEPPLYLARRKIYPQSVHGTFRRIKWTVLIVTLGIYYFLPFVRWDRGPNAPDQAVLIDFPDSRFYFFFIEIWPQEVYYFTGLLILAAMTLFLMNAVAGRVWCGYLCPQTVWTDLFLTIERFVEGDRREQILPETGPWTAKRISARRSSIFSG